MNSTQRREHARARARVHAARRTPPATRQIQMAHARVAGGAPARGLATIYTRSRDAGALDMQFALFSVAVHAAAAHGAAHSLLVPPDGLQQCPTGTVRDTTGTALVLQYNSFPRVPLPRHSTEVP